MCGYHTKKGTYSMFKSIFKVNKMSGEAAITGVKDKNIRIAIIPSKIRSCKVTAIGDNAFEKCKSLKKVFMPDSVTSIGEFAFDNCTSLKSITIPDSVTSIGCAAFSNCDSLTSITIPDSVTSIG